MKMLTLVPKINLIKIIIILANNLPNIKQYLLGRKNVGIAIMRINIKKIKKYCKY